MRFKIIFILIIVSILTSDYAFAQQDHVKKDSTTLYRNIESYSGRSKFTKFMYNLFFKPVPKSKKKGVKKRLYKKLIQKPYSSFEGKTIRSINIETLDPFGYSIGDTIAPTRNFLSRTGNQLHIKTRDITIRNLLLFHRNQLFDSLRVKESERLIRSRGFVTDVSFFVKTTSSKSDSVDIYIRELDNWSLVPAGSISASRINIDLTDKNFMGLGHEAKAGFTWNHNKGSHSYNINYFIPNIRNTYVNSTFHYDMDEFKNYIRSFAFDRPFFSPLAKWAAGMSFMQQSRNDSIHTSNSLYLQQRIKFNMQDFWAGKAIPVFKGTSEYNRTTNFITSIRYLRVHYLIKPIEAYDTQHFFANEDFYMASIGISTRKYVQDKFIFRYGITEDVPVGKVFSLTGGYQIKNNAGRLYLGARISMGNYYPWGYFGFNSEYGTFFRGSHTEQGVFSAAVNYFTGLFEVGKWKFRQFVKPQLTIGINRFTLDSLTINNRYGLDGFNSPALSGTSRLLFMLQTQSYAPWNFIGFRFGPFLTLSFGALGNATTGFQHSQVYSQIGFGVLIKNENLVINTFQLSIAFYPLIPGRGQNILKLNSIKTTDFGFRDFEIGKPDIGIYR